MKSSIAIVGMACRYPEARSPLELWQNVLAQRQAFRRIPAERLRLADYFSAEDSAGDFTYVTEAALIEGYEFDRVRFRVAGSTFRAADLVHWLALDIAAQALSDAGFPEGEELPRETTGVLLGNTLTGEFSRANALRLRWPYVRRVVEAALLEQGWSPAQRRDFLQKLETQYKAPFPPISEESLAGGLSNTIAGRICNYFDLKGGGYTVDGACASSLLAVTTACSALAAGDLDLALAGGVDLSLDPFELVGFARVGALAAEKMRVYDARSAGFWPGEGCGFVVLMRSEEAAAQGRRIYAVIRGWGVSSDGSGGITRPEVEGQTLAIQRAYRRAGFGVETVAYFEGHGTGTGVGDATELRALNQARRTASGPAPAAVIGSVKANIGHTKAAAGVAGLIKTAMALHTQILPPTTGCENPHPELAGEAPALRILRAGQPWPSDRPLRAGVSAMGFGGINTHIVLETDAGRRKALEAQEYTLLSSAQDAELFLLSAPDAFDLQQQVDHLLAFASKLSRSELVDLAARLEKTLEAYPVRAAIVATDPAELAGHLATLSLWLAAGSTRQLDTRSGLFLGVDQSKPRLGFLFPGQGSPAPLDGGAWRRRFGSVARRYTWANLPQQTGQVSATGAAQPAIVTASLAALDVLAQFGLTAKVAIGHSLGELTALHWAEAMDEAALLRIARVRGQAMGQLGSPSGAMASIEAGPRQVKELLNGVEVVIAGLNSPRQTVISGEAPLVEAMIARARARGLNAVKLPVSQAFHSPLVAAAAPPLAVQLSGEDLQPLQRSVISTVTGAPLAPDEDLRRLLYDQITAPVRFTEAMRAAGDRIDLWIEVGPGQVLSRLVAGFVETPVVALDAGGPSLKGLLQAIGAAFVLGAPINHPALFADRFRRPFDLNWQPHFLVSPCELAPLAEASTQPDGPAPVPVEPIAVEEAPARSNLTANGISDRKILALVQRLVAERTELPVSAVSENDRLLSDLHLNSITVSQLVVEAAGTLNLPPPASPTDYADVRVADVARALEELVRTGSSRSLDEQKRLPMGLDSWIQTFTVELVERPLPRHPRSTERGDWRVIAPPGYPLAEPLQQAFDLSGSGDGVVVCLPAEADEGSLSLLLEGTRAALQRNAPTRFVLVQPGGEAAVLARTLHLEAPTVITCVVDIPLDQPMAAEWVVAEAMAAVKHSEACYDSTGRRREPLLRLLPTANEPEKLPLDANDVLLITGGGKGITAECALALAQKTGAKLALLGRSKPAEDPELAANLARMAAADIQFRYISADVTDSQAVRAAIHEVETHLGPITGIIHGAARNEPARLSALDEATFRRTLAPKVQGAQNLLAAVDPDQLRLFVAFGSIIARTGLPGEADYGLANAWLTRLVERFQDEHPACRCLVVEWSIWSEVGMATRLGGVDRLVQLGITPIPPDRGVDIFLRLLSQPLPTVAVAVTGRCGELPTLKIERPHLPFRRFFERARVYYPQVELIVESDLSAEADLYLEDHIFRGERIFPAVMGLEAMAQTAMALVGTVEPPTFQKVQFKRPIVVPLGAMETLRVAALGRGPGQVEVALRCQSTAFQVDHFRAMCQFGRQDMAREGPGANPPDLKSVAAQFPLIDLDPERDLYGRLLFHRGRFRRLRGYRQLAATSCLAEIGPNGATAWFGRYLPHDLTLGDPGARDAVLHAIQACVPQATLLPIGVERLIPGIEASLSPRFAYARERARLDNIFTYDVVVTDSNGRIQERWEGLQFQIINGTTFEGSWAAPLLAPYLERQVQELTGAPVAIVIEQDRTAERRARSDRAIQRALGRTAPIGRKPDGKPEVIGDSRVTVSAAHSGSLTLAVTGGGPLGCDVESVTPRPVSVWRDLLGPERFELSELIARETGEDGQISATRVWTACECLKKTGAPLDVPLILNASSVDGWVMLTAGQLAVATYVAQIRGVENQQVFTILAREEP